MTTQEINPELLARCIEHENMMSAKCAAIYHEQIGKIRAFVRSIPVAEADVIETIDDADETEFAAEVTQAAEPYELAYLRAECKMAA